MKPLKNIKESELKSYDLQSTIEVVGLLEEVLLVTEHSVKAIEEMDEYMTLAQIIIERIENKDFDKEAKESGQEVLIPLLKQQLVALKSNFNSWFQFYSFKRSIESLVSNIKNEKDAINNLESNIDQTASDLGELNQKIKKTEAQAAALLETKEKLDATVTATEEHIVATKTDLTNFKNNIAAQVAISTKKIEDSEHTILTHVLTLLGVFSAIITIVMSIAITSNAWLNGAGATDAILAFIIPNFVTLIAVIVLLTLVFAYQETNKIEFEYLQTDDDNDNTDNNGSVPSIIFKETSAFTPTVKFGILFVVILLLCGSIAVFSIIWIKPNKPSHTIYIIPSSEYKVSDKYDDPETEIKEKSFMFTFDDIDCYFPYSKKSLHGEDLHYCSECNQLE